MRETLKLVIVLFLIAAVAGLALGVTNEITKAPIQEQAALAAENARRGVLPEATMFSRLDPLPEGIDNAYMGKNDHGKTVGYTAQTTVQGFGGEIQIIVGMDKEGRITGINVGGSSFSETPGLGAKTKDADFTEQFVGLVSPVEVGRDIDAVSAATISSVAVTGGVNLVCEYLIGLLK